MDTVLMQCRCDHEFQDERYNTTKEGTPTRAKLRVHNVTFKGQDATCTVCGSKKPTRGTGKK